MTYLWHIIHSRILDLLYCFFWRFFSCTLCWLSTQVNALEVCSIIILFLLLKENSFVILCSVGNISMNSHLLKHTFTVCPGHRDQLDIFFFLRKHTS